MQQFWEPLTFGVLQSHCLVLYLCIYLTCPSRLSLKSGPCHWVISPLDHLAGYLTHSSAINCSTSVVWMNACMHTWETSSVRWDLMGKRNLKCRHKLKESSSRERSFKFQYFVQKAVIIQTLGSHFEMFASRVKILLTDGVSSSFEKMLIFIRLSNVYPIIWLYHFWLYDEQLVVFKIECFNSSSIWSLRLLWQPPWKLWKALS